MIFKTRPGIKKSFDMMHDFGLQNIIVSGCSFTYNNHETSAVTWPYYLRDLGGFDQVYDTSMPGAGNYHISNSLIWALESDQLDPEKSLVIVMWSGADRDDYITPSSNINEYPFGFNYSKNVSSAITGGSHPAAGGNTLESARHFFATKTNESRSIENYLYITNTWNYLQNNGYRFVFLNWCDSDLPSRAPNHFDIKKHLPTQARKNLENMIVSVTDPYEFALKNDLLWDDDFHPSPTGHLTWTKTILLPKLQQLFG